MRQVLPPRPEDEAIVCFTSGTTGNPKGAMLTHKNFCTAIGGVAKSISVVAPDHTDRVISYLPLAHVFEQVRIKINRIEEIIYYYYKN